jgi:hypothetical protein
VFRFALFVFLVLLTACSSGGGGGITLASSASEVSARSGGSGQVILSVQGSGSIALALIQAPDGVTATFNPPVLQGGGESIMNVSVETSLAAGRYPLVVVASSGSAERSLSLTLVVEDQPGPQPPAGEASPFFMPNRFEGEVHNTRGSVVLVDPSGGVHAFYWGHGKEFYAYCSGLCSSEADFHLTALTSEIVSGLVADLDGEGKPAVMVETDRAIEYGKCTGDCAQASSWTFYPVLLKHEVDLGNSGLGTYRAKGALAHDRQGRPHFLIFDDFALRMTGQSPVYYAYCARGSCTRPDDWNGVRLFEDDLLYAPRLALTASGQPRLLYARHLSQAEVGQGNETGVYVAYAECNAGCTDAANWQEFVLMQLSNTSDFTNELSRYSLSLAVDRQDRVHVAFYTGALYSELANTLFYAQCAGGCAAGPDGWTVNLPWGANPTDSSGNQVQLGKHVELDLDEGGRPHMAFVLGSSSHIYYQYCERDCTTSEPKWRGAIVESAAELSESDLVIPSTRAAPSASGPSSGPRLESAPAAP